jgi:hypothetical protein
VPGYWGWEWSGGAQCAGSACHGVTRASGYVFVSACMYIPMYVVRVGMWASGAQGHDEASKWPKP